MSLLQVCNFFANAVEIFINSFCLYHSPKCAENVNFAQSVKFKKSKKNQCLKAVVVDYSPLNILAELSKDRLVGLQLEIKNANSHSFICDLSLLPLTFYSSFL
jgi:hypothetical protein